MKALTQERLKELLRYDPLTGEFHWRSDRRGGARQGDLAGSTYADGYRKVRVDIRKYSAHHLAWFCVHGVWPAQCLDHRDGVRDNNRIANLRDATHAQNQQNRAAKEGGQLGVRLKKGRWEAAISVAGCRHYLGRFDTEEQAGTAYLAAKRKLHQFQPTAPTPRTKHEQLHRAASAA